MNGINIYLADEDYDGAITMSADTSQIIATRVSRDRVSDFNNELNGPGIYFLLVGSDSVYVGQTRNDTIQKRIMNTHSGNIDSSWHTVVGFKFPTTMSTDQLLYIENAMCEYAHNNYTKCLTTNPTRTKCNAHYRKYHYNLTIAQERLCDQCIRDIKNYITIFPNTIFPAIHRQNDQQLSIGGNDDGVTFYYKEAKMIVIDNDYLVLIGSKINPTLQPSCPPETIKDREKYSPIIVDNVLIDDAKFTNPSSAAKFVLGGSVNGRTAWKDQHGRNLRQIEAQEERN